METTRVREVDRIADQLKRAFEGDAWHGPSVRQVLEGVSAEQAARRPLPEAHTIWEIALHIEAWERAAARRLAGEPAQLAPHEDWPPPGATDERAWQQARERLEAGHRDLVRAISSLDDARLDQPVLEGFSTVYTTLHGVVQHDLYHAGQIALLRKAVAG